MFRFASLKFFVKFRMFSLKMSEHVCGVACSIGDLSLTHFTNSFCFVQSFNAILICDPRVTKILPNFRFDLRGHQQLQSPPFC